MPYAHDLQNKLQSVIEWADLRHEQGVAVDPTLDALRSALDRAADRLQKARRPADLADREPDDLVAIRALRPNGPRRLRKGLFADDIGDRMAGAWLGRAAGCTLGVPVEQWPVDDMEAWARKCRMAYPPTDYWTDHPTPARDWYKTNTLGDYLKGRINAVPVDDDLTYTFLGLRILERFGPDFSTADVAKAWKDWLPMACTAEEVALRNLKAGVDPYKAAEINNPFQEWIGADIRSDSWGYAAPGWPERAAEMAYRDAYLSHRGNGIYGEMFFAAAIAAAFTASNPREALEIGLTEIPKTCRLYKDIRWALNHAKKLKGWRDAHDAVAKRFKGMHAVHTNNNACLTVFGLLLGNMDFTRTIGLTVAMGLDNDCTTATAGSIIGSIIGKSNIPGHWWKPFRNRSRTYLKGHGMLKNDDIVRRFLAMAKRVHDLGK
ncbi:MAG: hypothetical protein AMXMBFR84_19460 [Candidatus Hydrogenedentota bacterium]